MRKRFIPLVLVAIAIAGAAAHADEWSEPTFPDKPPRKHFYVDEARLIAPEDGAEIDRIAGALLREEQVPIIVVTISSMASYGAGDWSIERYAQALFDHWGIGRENRNYGILLLISQGDRRARIELGGAWGGRHDAAAYDVMDDLIIPAFKKGRFSQGILDGVRGLDAMARDLQLPKPKRAWWQPLIFIGLFALGVGVAISLIKSGRKGWGWALLAALGVILFFVLRTAISQSGSGGSFGGGSSGGGGATGSW
jgi:uncharacterized protein